MMIFQSSDFYVALALSVVGVYLFYLIGRSLKVVFRSYLMVFLFILLVFIRPIMFDLPEQNMALSMLLGLTPMLIILAFINIFFKGTYKTNQFLVKSTPPVAKPIQRIFLKPYKTIMYLCIGILFFVFFILSFLVEAALPKYFLMGFGLIGTFINIYLIYLNNRTKAEYLISITENEIITYPLPKTYHFKFGRPKELIANILVSNEQKDYTLYHVTLGVDVHLDQTANNQMIEQLLQTLNPYQYVSYKLMVEDNHIKQTIKLNTF